MIVWPMAYIQGNVADNGFVIRKSDVSRVTLNTIDPMLLLFGDECSLYVDTDSSWGKDCFIKGGRSSLHAEVIRSI